MGSNCISGKVNDKLIDTVFGGAVHCTIRLRLLLCPDPPTWYCACYINRDSKVPWEPCLWSFAGKQMEATMVMSPRSPAPQQAMGHPHSTNMDQDQKSHTVTALWALSLFGMKRKPSERNEGLFIYLLINLIRKIWLNYFPHRVHFTVGVSKPFFGVSLKTKGSRDQSHKWKYWPMLSFVTCLLTFRRERCEAGAMTNKISFSASRGEEDKAQVLDVFILYWWKFCYTQHRLG